MSSIIDATHLLHYVEADDEVRRVPNVLKIRGSQNDKRILHYDIGQKGIALKDD